MALKKLAHLASIPAGATAELGTFDVTKIRTLTCTVRVSYDAAASSGLQLKYYHVPTKNRKDTVPISTETIDFTAGQTVQKTLFIASPEEGQLSFTLENTDATKPATDINVWLTYERWKE